MSKKTVTFLIICLLGSTMMLTSTSCCKSGCPTINHGDMNKKAKKPKSGLFPTSKKRKK